MKPTPPTELEFASLPPRDSQLGHHLHVGSKTAAQSCSVQTRAASGVGAALARGIIRRAEAAGYQKMKLETGIRQVAAQRLYERLGFQDVEPYYPVSDTLRPLARFMVIRLPRTSAA